MENKLKLKIKKAYYYKISHGLVGFFPNFKSPSISHSIHKFKENYCEKICSYNKEGEGEHEASNYFNKTYNLITYFYI